MDKPTLYDRCSDIWSELYFLAHKSEDKTPEATYLTNVMSKDKLAKATSELYDVLLRLGEFQTYQRVKQTLEASTGDKEAPSGHVGPV